MAALSQHPPDSSTHAARAHWPTTRRALGAQLSQAAASTAAGTTLPQAPGITRRSGQGWSTYPVVLATAHPSSSSTAQLRCTTRTWARARLSCRRTSRPCQLQLPPAPCHRLLPAPPRALAPPARLTWHRARLAARRAQPPRTLASQLVQTSPDVKRSADLSSL